MLYYATWDQIVTEYAKKELYKGVEGHYHKTIGGAQKEAERATSKRYYPTIKIHAIDEEKEVDFYAVTYWSGTYDIDIEGYFKTLADAEKYYTGQLNEGGSIPQDHQNTTPVNEREYFIISAKWGEPIDIELNKRVILD